MAKRALNSAARFTARTADKAASGLFRWATTDHSGMGKLLDIMPKMGILDTLGYILSSLFYSVIGTLFGAVLVFIIFAYGIPLLLFGHL